MVMMGWQEILLMLLLSGGGNGDLLDYTPTDLYWQSARQAHVDVQAMAGIATDADAAMADQLMAIRTLGELGRDNPADKPAVLKALGPLVDSKAPFVGQYAKRSLAWVNGKDPEAPGKATAAQLADAVALLPRTSDLVGQMRIHNQAGPIDLSKLFVDNKLPNAPKPEVIRKQVGEMVFQAAQYVGNARIDALSVGVTTANDSDGPFAFVIRGQYSRAKAIAAIQEAVKREPPGNYNFYSIGEVEVVAIDDGMHGALLMPSDQVIIAVFSENKNTPLPLGEIAEAANKGADKLQFSDRLNGQIREIDRAKSEAWLAMEVSGAINKTELSVFFGAFDAMRLSAGRNQEKGGMDVRVNGIGQDKDKVLQSTMFLQGLVAVGQQQVRGMLQQNQLPDMNPMFEQILKAMASIKIEAKEKAFTAEANVPDGLGELLPMMFLQTMTNRAGAINDVAEDAVEEDVELIAP